MEIIMGDRATGKTTELIKLAAKDFLYIVCTDRSRAERVNGLAREMDLDIPFPITFKEFLNGEFGRGQHLRGFVIDDVDQLLRQAARGKPIRAISFSTNQPALERVESL